MPTFFFDTHDGSELSTDQSGLVLDGIEAARKEAVCTLPEIVREVLPDGDERTVFIVIRDDRGDQLFRASLTLKCEWLR